MKTYTYFACLVLVLALSACGGGSDPEPTCTAGNCDTDGDNDTDTSDNDATEMESADTDIESANGMWHDTITGLIWQNPPAGDSMILQKAAAYCENLSLDNRWDWRLPTIDELRSLVRGCSTTITGGSCGIGGDCFSWNECRVEEDCDGCSEGGGPAEGCYWPSELQGSCHNYESSSFQADSSCSEWSLDFSTGLISSTGFCANGTLNHVRCVRGGKSAN